MKPINTQQCRLRVDGVIVESLVDFVDLFARHWCVILSRAAAMMKVTRCNALFLLASMRFLCVDAIYVRCGRID